MIRFLLASTIWTVLVALVSLIPSSSFDADQFKIEGLDKLIHLIMYTLLTLFWSTGLKRQYKSKTVRKYAFHISIFGGIIFSLIIEILQEYLVNSRSFEWLDLIANGIGCIFGVLLFKLIYKGAYK